jgi:hypothetical protein
MDAKAPLVNVAYESQLACSLVGVETVIAELRVPLERDEPNVDRSRRRATRRG